MKDHLGTPSRTSHAKNKSGSMSIPSNTGNTKSMPGPMKLGPGGCKSCRGSKKP